LSVTAKGSEVQAQNEQSAILVLAGATGVGKTRVAIELCKRLGGEIVGADSVQIQRGLDVGSCKPTADELQGVAHHLLDVLEPTESIDAARYALLADAAIADVVARGGVPVVVGGTGLWLRALLRGLLVLPPVDRELRAELERAWHRDGAEPMHRKLGEVDPRSAAAIHRSDMVRVVRALEVHAQTGLALGELRAAHARGEPRYRALMLVLDLPKEQWRTAIAERARGMFERGLVEETRALIARYGADLRALRSVGYRQVALGLQQGSELSEIELQVVHATRLYGKRQRNWFRGEPGVDLRLDPSAALGPPALEAMRAHLGLR
jgi:tRNA dimethylallyltransferase